MGTKGGIPIISPKATCLAVLGLPVVASPTAATTTPPSASPALPTPVTSAARFAIAVAIVARGGLLIGRARRGDCRSRLGFVGCHFERCRRWVNARI